MYSYEMAYLHKSCFHYYFPYQVLDILEKKKDLDFVLIDTPGQIEVFTWSASGTIISDAIARSYPTVIAFIMDTVRFAV